MVPSSLVLVLVGLLVATDFATSQLEGEEVEHTECEDSEDPEKCEPVSAKKTVLGFFDQPPREVSVPIFGSLIIDCKAGGIPPPLVIWTDGGRSRAQRKLRQALRRNLLEDYEDGSYLGIGVTSSRLSFECITPEDKGDYTCAAGNGKEEVFSPVRIKLLKNKNSPKGCPEEVGYGEVFDLGLPPKIYMWTTDRFEYVGGSATLFCRADGNPQPSRGWAKIQPDNPLQRKERYEIQDTGDLELSRLAWGSDLHHKCLAQNARGRDAVEVSVYQVAGPNEESGGKNLEQTEDSLVDMFGKIAVNDTVLKFYSTPPENVTFSAFKNHSLECTAFGVPPPKVYWTKNGVPVSAVQDMGEILDASASNDTYLAIGTTKAKLQVTCATADDSGEYACVADNGYDIVSTSTRVKITGAKGDDPCRTTKLTSGRPPKVVMGTSNRFEYVGRYARLFCRAEGIPSPAITWYAIDENNVLKPLPDGRFLPLDSGDLLIRKVQPTDPRTYVCYARNIHGRDRNKVTFYPVE